MKNKGIPYTDALKRSDILIRDITDILDCSLLIGNGDVNGILYRSGKDLIINITKNDVWDSRFENNKDHEIVTAHELINSLDSLDDADTHEYLPVNMDVPFDKEESYSKHPYPCPIICAKLHIKTNIKDEYESYKLSLGNAMIYARTDNGSSLEIFAHAKYNIFVVKGLKPDDDIYLESIQHIDMSPAIKVSTDNIEGVVQHIEGDMDVEPFNYVVAVKRFKEERFALVAVMTSKESANPLDGAILDICRLGSLVYNEIKEQHQSWWSDYWEASGIKLDDKLLECTWYRNLYFTACVCRAKKTAPGLFAGLAFDTPFWHGDYHLNYNFQQIFWGCYSANHSEMTQPYDDVIVNYLPRAKWLSKTIFDTGGAFYPHIIFNDEPIYPEKCISRNNRQYFHHVWGRTLGLAAFCAQNLWWHYKYTMDENVLKKIYPVISNCAEFYRQWGRLYPTVSPEHWGLTRKLEKNKRCTFDIAMIKFILKAAIEASLMLQKDVELRFEWEKYLNAIPDYPVTDIYFDNSFKKILLDVEGAQPTIYNIPVPLTPVFPGEDTSFLAKIENKEILLDTIAHLKTNENNDLVMGSMARIRLATQDAYSFLRFRILRHMRVNGTLAMAPDFKSLNSGGIYTETFGIVLPINELLLQSHEGIIDLFPVWPRNLEDPVWSMHVNAEFTDLLAQGAFLISAKCIKGKITEVHITSLRGGIIKIKNKWDSFRIIDIDRKTVDCSLDLDIIAFMTYKNHKYRIQVGM